MIPFESLSLPLLRAKDGWTYQVTPRDLLVMARSIRRESTRDGDAIPWMYAQRLYLLRRSYSSLAALATAYSQPINPAWFPSGRFCVPGGEYHGTRSCLDAPNRPGYAAASWESLGDATQTATARWARGDVPNPVPKVVHFAAESLVARQIAAGGTSEKRVIVRQGREPFTNTFLSTKTSREWPDDFIQLEVGGKVVGTTSNPLPYVLGALAIGAGVAVLVARKR